VRCASTTSLPKTYAGLNLRRAYTRAKRQASSLPHSDDTAGYVVQPVTHGVTGVSSGIIRYHQGHWCINKVQLGVGGRLQYPHE
jgi:hypothetical protein